GSGATVHAVQNGTTGVVFVDGQGRMSLGAFLSGSTTQATDNLYPGDVATFSSGHVTWQDGTIWTVTTSPSSHLSVTHYTNAGGNSTYTIRNGNSQVIFVDQS